MKKYPTNQERTSDYLKKFYRKKLSNNCINLLKIDTQGFET